MTVRSAIHNKEKVDNSENEWEENGKKKKRRIDGSVEGLNGETTGFASKGFFTGDGKGKRKAQSLERVESLLGGRRGEEEAIG